jgi:hypothetical protein
VLAVAPATAPIPVETPVHLKTQIPLAVAPATAPIPVETPIHLKAQIPLDRPMRLGWLETAP